MEIFNNTVMSWICGACVGFLVGAYAAKKHILGKEDKKKGNVIEGQVLSKPSIFRTKGKL